MIRLLTGLGCAFAGAHAETLELDLAARRYSVEASAVVSTNIPCITLEWRADAQAASYAIYRKTAGTWTEIAQLEGSAVRFPDPLARPGSPIEYQIIKTTANGAQGYGYVLAGLDLPPVEHRGTLILIVQQEHALDLAQDLMQLEQDLIGDGWNVRRHDVSQNASIHQVKKIIQSDFAADPQNTRAVFLFGNIPVPYSGDITPDDHPDSHMGAWPADVFYGDVDGVWTDEIVSSKNSLRAANWNEPGDGKFDQSLPPSAVELEVGRVDLSRMTAFINKPTPRSERDLLREYLRKNHRFRHGQVDLERRGLVVDYLNFKGDDPVVGTAWRNYAAFFGAGSPNGAVAHKDFFPTSSTGSYLWGFAAGGGDYYKCYPVGSSDTVATNQIQIAFMMALGSYFGDWDNESNFLRALLASSPNVLTVTWSGFPHWFFHNMALGETIGFSTRLTQNNRPGASYPPHEQGAGQVHISLLGDPSLRMHPVKPPSALAAATESGAVQLSWTASTDTNIIGYFVYRSDSVRGPYIRVSGDSPVTATRFSERTSSPGPVYMVRAIKKEHSGSGSYFNLSQGAFASQVPWQPRELTAHAASGSQIQLKWVDLSANEDGFRVERLQADGRFIEIGVAPPNSTQFVDSNLSAGGRYTYRVSSFQGSFSSEYSDAVTAATTLLQVVRTDYESQGTWKRRYGAEGFHVAGTPPRPPLSISYNLQPSSLFVWKDATDESRGLQHPSNATRIAACWSAADKLILKISCNDQLTHRLALYFLDWDKQGRAQEVEIFDSDGGRRLDAQTLSEFQNGKYMIWEITGQVTIHISRRTGPNVVLSGLFFDPESRVAAPVISPAGGAFLNSRTVTLSSITPDAVIHFTTNGALPTLSSPAYSQPIELRRTTTLQAKAFRIGMSESILSSEVFTLNPVAVFVGNDTSTQGNWPGTYGQTGYFLVGAEVKIPPEIILQARRHLSHEWPLTNDVRVLRKSPDSNDRLPSCWFSEASFDIDLNLSDGKTHRVALYSLDYERKGSAMTIEVLDAANGNRLDMQNVSQLENGQYLVWDLRGHVQFRLSRIILHSVVMGVFIDPAPRELTAQPIRLTQILRSNPHETSIQLSGNTGQSFLLEQSVDLHQWFPILTQKFSGSILDVTLPKHQAQEFFRARALND